jgi:hypothetical protein
MNADTKATAYPNLKANQNMLAVQEKLTSTENKVAFARQRYNDSKVNPFAVGISIGEAIWYRCIFLLKKIVTPNDCKI